MPIIYLILALVLVYFIAKFLFSALTIIYGLSIIFSKITVSLAVAFILQNTCPLLSQTPFAGFAIWSAICVGACLLLSILPRIDCALEFFTKSIVTYIVGLLVFSFIQSLLGLHLGNTGNLITKIVLKLLVLYFAGSSLMEKLHTTNLRRFSTPLLTLPDRLLASALYGLSALVLVVADLPPFPDLVILGILISSFVLSFLLDIFLISRH